MYSRVSCSTRDSWPACRADDRRVQFIHASVRELDARLRELGGYLIVRHGRAAQEIPRLAAELDAESVFANHDYEPQAIARDRAVADALARGRPQPADASRTR